MHRATAAGLYLVITLFVVAGDDAATALSEAADSALPSFELITFGGEVYGDKLLQGHPTLLVFWAPWCNVCQRELPLLEQFYRQSPQLSFVCFRSALLTREQMWKRL
jgi:thiol-disulfide isomerase/thioredoxin